MLATFSLYPIVKAFSSSANVDVVMKDISVAGRVIAGFPENLTEEQKIPDELYNLGEMAKTPAANIIKLPNISASIPQLKACVAELQGQGYKIPDFPEDPQTPEEKAIRERYNKVLGSAVNPVLREGHLRWDSLGEFLAYASCLEDNAAKNGDPKLSALAKALDKANERFLDANKNPSRRGKEIDNRGSHFYLALYWAQELAKCGEAPIEKAFVSVAKELTDNEATIMKELIDCQGPSVDLGGYYKVDPRKTEAAMRPSATLNSILARFEQASNV